MIAAIPNIIGWLAISFAKVLNKYMFPEFIFTHCCFWKHKIDACHLSISVLQDASFLYMGRLPEGFGVGIISYTVRKRRFVACLFLVQKIFVLSKLKKLVQLLLGKVRDQNIEWDSNILGTFRGKKWRQSEPWPMYNLFVAKRTLEVWTNYSTISW